MTSLHDLAQCNAFASWAKTLWNRWNTGHGGVAALDYREAYIKRCARNMLNLCGVPRPTVTITNNAGHSGSTDPEGWEIEIEGPINNNNIKLKDFVELFTTTYHEMRHIEQFYRIVQALALDLLDWDVKDRHSRKIDKPTTGAGYFNALEWQANACTHAINNTGTYNQFSASPRMDHCERGSVPDRANDKWTKTVMDWWLTLVNKHRQNLYAIASTATVGTGVGQISKVYEKQYYYRSPEDKDTFAMEAKLKGSMCGRWTRFNSRQQNRRTDNPPFTNQP